MTGIAATKAGSRFARWKTALLLNMLGLAVAGIKILAPLASETSCAATPPLPNSRPVPRLASRPETSVVQLSHAPPSEPDWLDKLLPLPDGFRRLVTFESDARSDVPCRSASLI